MLSARLLILHNPTIVNKQQKTLFKSTYFDCLLFNEHFFKKPWKKTH